MQAQYTFKRKHYFRLKPKKKTPPNQQKPQNIKQLQQK